MERRIVSGKLVLNRDPGGLYALLGGCAYQSVIRLRRTLLRAKKRKVGDINYLEINNGKSETILLLHGFTDSKDGLLSPAFYLSKHYNILIPDLPGWGENKKVYTETYNLIYMAEKIGEFLKERGVSSLYLAGISMGAAVSMELALLHPEMFKGLVLIAPAGFFDKKINSVFHELIGGKNIFCVDDFSDYENFLNRIMAKKPFIPMPIKKYLFNKLFLSREWHLKMTEDLLVGIKSIEEEEKIKENSFNNRSKEIKCQTLLIWGDQDSLFPLELSQIPLLGMENCELITIKDAGHALHHERPLEFSLNIHKFIQKNYLNKKSFK